MSMKTLLALVTASAALLASLSGSGCGSTNPSDSCASIAGSFLVSGANTCTGVGTSRLTVTQNGCSFTGTFDLSPLPSVLMTGTMAGNTANVTLDFKPLVTGACAGSGSGTLNVNGNTVSGTFQASQPQAGCCGTFSGNFAFTK